MPLAAFNTIDSEDAVRALALAAVKLAACAQIEKITSVAVGCLLARAI